MLMPMRVLLLASRIGMVLAGTHIINVVIVALVFLDHVEAVLALVGTPAHVLLLLLHCLVHLLIYLIF